MAEFLFNQIKTKRQGREKSSCFFYVNWKTVFFVNFRFAQWIELLCNSWIANLWFALWLLFIQDSIICYANSRMTSVPLDHIFLSFHVETMRIFCHSGTERSGEIESNGILSFAVQTPEWQGWGFYTHLCSWCRKACLTRALRSRMTVVGKWLVQNDGG